jgi:hypothetical protein
VSTGEAGAAVCAGAGDDDVAGIASGVEGVISPSAKTTLPVITKKPNSMRQANDLFITKPPYIKCKKGVP